MVKKGKRKYRRKSTIVLLDVAYEDKPGETTRAAIVDISLGGCAFETRREFDAGRKVLLKFTLQKKKVYLVSGEIKRVRPGTGAYVHGVQFEGTGIIERIKRKRLINKIS